MPVVFEHGDFKCDVDVFTSDRDLLVRFYHSGTEPSAEHICNAVFVEPGHGFIYLKFKDADSGLIGGFLDSAVFSEDLACAAVEFVESLSPLAEDAYLPHHVSLVRREGFIEYNGEF